ncbi:hypothetical protein ABZS29_35415 [Kribbella sp. NPDC005582]|uniref:hypothetical protein n=1 Tax=Kribbella sp. NPDC005582 TaxID=3156893 RepID=UPI0033AAA9E1
MTDDEIAALSPAERRDLILRLVPRPDGLPSERTINRIRKWRTVLILLGSLALIPWTVYLAVTLPNHYVARHWVATWVGFDVLLLATLLWTAIAGWKRRVMVFPTAVVSGVLLLCDAWFDVLTSQRSDLMQAVLSAVLLEVPLALILIGGPLKLMRYLAVRYGVVDSHTHFWSLPIPVPDLYPNRQVPTRGPQP